MPLQLQPGGPTASTTSRTTPSARTPTNRGSTTSLKTPTNQRRLQPGLHRTGGLPLPPDFSQDSHNPETCHRTGGLSLPPDFRRTPTTRKPAIEPEVYHFHQTPARTPRTRKPARANPLGLCTTRNYLNPVSLNRKDGTFGQAPTLPETCNLELALSQKEVRQLVVRKMQGCLQSGGLLRPSRLLRSGHLQLQPWLLQNWMPATSTRFSGTRKTVPSTRSPPSWRPANFEPDVPPKRGPSVHHEKASRETTRYSPLISGRARPTKSWSPSETLNQREKIFGLVPTQATPSSHCSHN